MAGRSRSCSPISERSAACENSQADRPGHHRHETLGAYPFPTIAESGLPGFEVAIWYGLVAPRGTAKSVIARLNDEVGRVLKLPEVKERLTQLGFESDTITPEEFRAYIDSEFSRFARVLKDAGIRPN